MTSPIDKVIEERAESLRLAERADSELVLEDILETHTWPNRVAFPNPPTAAKEEGPLTALLEMVRSECSNRGCEGPYEVMCAEAELPPEDWCPWCRIGVAIQKYDATLAGNEGAASWVKWKPGDALPPPAIYRIATIFPDGDVAYRQASPDGFAGWHDVELAYWSVPLPPLYSPKVAAR